MLWIAPNGAKTPGLILKNCERCACSSSSSSSSSISSSSSSSNYCRNCQETGKPACCIPYSDTLTATFTVCGVDHTVVFDASQYLSGRTTFLKVQGCFFIGDVGKNGLGTNCDFPYYLWTIYLGGVLIPNAITGGFDRYCGTWGQGRYATGPCNCTNAGSPGCNRNDSIEFPNGYQLRLVSCNPFIMQSIGVLCCKTLPALHYNTLTITQ